MDHKLKINTEKDITENINIHASILANYFKNTKVLFEYEEWLPVELINNNQGTKEDLEDYINSKEFRSLRYIGKFNQFKEILQNLYLIT